MKKMFDMKTLNTSQKRIVMLPADVDILSVAGPGSGKTRTITYRLGYLAMACGILPSRLRAVTFTRAATQEMEERLGSLDPSLESVRVSTIHQLCRDIIKETQEAVLESPNFQCYVKSESAKKKKKPDTAVEQALVRFLERDSAIKRLYLKIAKRSGVQFSPEKVAKALLKSNDRGNPKEILQQYINYRKTQMHCKQHIGEVKLPTFSFQYARYVQCLPRYANEKVLYEGIYKHYCEILKEWRIFDYTDQIIFAHLGLLSCSEKTRLALQSQWDILAVDEFQDVDAVQFEVFRLLCAGRMKLNAVGDPDQAIYGFRGGDPIFISNFKKWFPGAEIVKLDTNYRSHAEIIDVAYSAVEDTEQPYRAKGESANGVGGSVGFARQSKISDFSAKGSVGVLAWTNGKLNEVSRSLLKRGILCSINTRWRSRLNVSERSYRVVSQTLQALGMVTGTVDFNREKFLKSAQNVKGIADAVMKTEGETLEELCESPRVKKYVVFLRRLKGLKTPDMVRTIIEPEVFKVFQEIEDKGQILEYREAFAAAAAAFDFSETYQKVRDKVKIKLYTIHKAKGLEFDTVFVDTEDFAKPFARDNVDESKRLLFVALSRAKRHLFLLGGADQGNSITGPVICTIKEILEEEPNIESETNAIETIREIEPGPKPKTDKIHRVPYKARETRDYLASQRRKKIQNASEQLQREFPGDWRLESDLFTIGPTPFILEKIRRVRSKPL